jgi:GNAT superfamily N-acetyltransferase
MATVPSLTLPAGLSARFAVRDDVPAITELIAACERADDGVAEIDPDDVRFVFSRAGTIPENTLLVSDGGRLAAWADLYQERAEVCVHPGWRGWGIGTALLAWTEERARATGRERVRQTTTDANEAAAALFRAHGYSESHTSWILQIGFEDGPPAEPVVPDGVVLRAYEETDARAVHRLIDDAFCEWPGREPEEFRVWAPFVVAHGSFSQEMSRLAFDRDELVGAALSFDYAEADEGWIQQVATRASHRHRGIARALLHSVFAAFYERGRPACGLSTDSRTGALSLYEKVGMHVRRSYTGWIKAV